MGYGLVNLINPEAPVTPPVGSDPQAATPGATRKLTMARHQYQPMSGSMRLSLPVFVKFSLYQRCLVVVDVPSSMVMMVSGEAMVSDG